MNSSVLSDEYVSTHKGGRYHTHVVIGKRILIHSSSKGNNIRQLVFAKIII